MWLFSAILHVSLLAALLITIPRIARGLQTPVDEEAREVGIVLKSQHDDQVIFENPERTLQQPNDATELNPPLLDDLTSPAMQAPAENVLPRIDETWIGAARSDASATDARPSASKAPGGQSRTTFWSVESVGSSFVFVIDRSASMAHRDALDLAKEQLFQSLAQLDPTNRFQIIFYNTDAQALSFGEGGLIEASQVNIARAKREVDRILPEGGTQHTKPLELAFQFRPEVVYFLTDADMFTEEDVSRMTAANRQGTQPATLFAIEFGNGPNLLPNKPLRRLAAENDGTYSYIDVQSFGSSLGAPQ